MPNLIGEEGRAQRDGPLVNTEVAHSRGPTEGAASTLTGTVKR